MVLHAELELSARRRALLEVVLVEREAEMVDARELPLAGLHDDVHAAALELREAQLEAAPVELLPRGAGLERGQVVRDPAVAATRSKPSLPR